MGFHGNQRKYLTGSYKIMFAEPSWSNMMCLQTTR